MIKTFIIGIERRKNNGVEEKLYRMLKCRIVKEDNRLKWDYKPIRLSEGKLIESMLSGESIENAYIDNGELTGSQGALSRFSTNNKQLVVLCEIVDGKDINRILGYKVANFNGAVKNIKIAEAIDMCKKYNAHGVIPIQNAIFVDDTEERKAHIKSYPGVEFLKDTISTGENKYAEKRNCCVASEERKTEEKPLNKLKELFTEEQIEQLRLGKNAGVNFKAYANPSLTPEQMCVLREGLEKRTDIRGLARPEYSVQAMKFYISEMVAGMDVSSYLSPKYNIEQLFILSQANESGVDIGKLSDPKLSPNDMQEILERLENGIWKDEFLTQDGKWSTSIKED